MDGMQTFIAVIFVALLLVGSGIALNVASQSTATKYTNLTDELQSDGVGTILGTNNESIDGAYYSDNAIVVNASSGETLKDSQDYTWYETNGTLEIKSGDAANTNLNVSYDWWDRSQTQITITESMSSLIGAGAYIPVILIVGLIMAVVGMMGGLS